MSKRTLAATPLFEVHNSDWDLMETAPGIYTLQNKDGSKALTEIEGAKLVAAFAVIAELDRHLREKK